MFSFIPNHFHSNLHFLVYSGPISSEVHGILFNIVIFIFSLMNGYQIYQFIHCCTKFIGIRYFFRFDIHICNFFFIYFITILFSFLLVMYFTEWDVFVCQCTLIVQNDQTVCHLLYGEIILLFIL